MAEETKTTASGAPAAAEVVVSDVSKTVVVEKEATVTAATPEPEPVPVPVPEPEKPTEEPAAAAEEAEKAVEEKITESASYKEETNVVGELPDPQKKAIEELKQLVRDALSKHEFTAPPPPPPPAKVEEKKPEEEEPKTTVEETKTEATGEDVKTEAAAEESKTEATVEETKVEVQKEAEEVPPPPPVVEEPPKVAEPAEPVEEKKEVVQPPAEAAKPSEPEAKVGEKAEAAAEEIKETIVEVTSTTTVAATQEAAATAPAVKETAKEETVEEPKEPEEVSIWGIPLLADERSDVILLKFLRARDFKVKDAFAMLKSVVAWRKEFGIEKLLGEEGIGSGLEKAVFMHGVDKEGHPVCYNAYGEFQDKEVYQTAFADAEKRSKFLRWRIQFLENSIRRLDFSPDGINTIVQVNDFKNSTGLFLFKKELRQATNQALQLLQDNYPEFVAKQVFINVPWWYVAYNRMISPFFTQRTKSKFVFVGPSKTTETLFKYIAPEQVPVQYGGLSREGEFSVAEPATEETIKPSSKHTVEFPVTEAGTLIWEARVVGWEVSYGAEFVPSAVGGYTVIIQKSRKITAADEAIICGSYKIGEPGKIVLTFDNQTSKKKKLLYRSKTKPSD